MAGHDKDHKSVRSIAGKKRTVIRITRSVLDEKPERNEQLSKPHEVC